ncbi:medium-chain acyl-CoA ligase ACSF2, mitochondrial [Nephila pilipes]|uniref:Medium-chain acyl-CoA ligase ACSF2, mitochondrial n=1 Tax=Nephila pilipes TaxID=299642 RepID=A0A8X6TM59_NEPPI|nr:medium-chain acyl-CoA ligase ACSF2, mitochondrial [Nephila pilipes]
MRTRFISEIQQKIKNSYYSMYGDVLLSSSRIGELLDESADKYGDQTAFISMHQNLSKNYSEFRNEADRLASGFISLGLRRGDRIAICSPNHYEWPLTQFAAAKAGLILVNLNPAFQQKELIFCLNKANCKALVISDVFKTQDYYKMLLQIAPDLPENKSEIFQSNILPDLERIIIISDNKKNGILNFKDVLNNGNKESSTILAETEKSIQFDDPVNIQFTSGTTGEPKGVVLSHHNLVNNALLGGRRYGYNLMKHIVCCHLPLFHSFGCVHISLSTVFFQGTCVFPSAGFDAVLSLQAIEKHKCSIIFGTPTMYVDLINNYKSGEFNITSLNRGILGGAAAPPSLVEDIKKVLKVPNIQVGYGATETSPAVACNKLTDDFENVAKAIMQPIEYVETKVINDKGQIVPVNSKGELCVRGHNVFMGYWEKEEGIKAIPDKLRWFHSGDLAVMNEYGYIKIVGRIKDIIIRGGENIYPLEVESFISTHPAVLEVHICSVPDERMGEEACAWINLKKNMNLNEEEVKQFCKGQISHFKIPKYIMFVKDFPKTHSGKIKKFEMSRISAEKLNL